MQDAVRIEQEREFHDQRFAAEEDRSSSRFYDITGRSAAAYREAVARLNPPAAVLELGCGDDAEAWQLSERGLDVTAIDISPVAVEHALQRAQDAGSDRLHFSVMNAEELEFPDASFDGVIGSGILHHLDLSRSVPEVARVLRPDGVAVFLEPLGANPIVNLYRRLTPGERTPDEHPLLRQDFELLQRWFERVELQFFHLTSLAALGLLKTRYFERSLSVLERIDERLLARSSNLQLLSWFVVVTLGEPKVRAGRR